MQFVFIINCAESYFRNNKLTHHREDAIELFRGFKWDRPQSKRAARCVDSCQICLCFFCINNILYLSCKQYINAFYKGKSFSATINKFYVRCSWGLNINKPLSKSEFHQKLTSYARCQEISAFFRLEKK
jgi:hypothetical protein